MHSWIGSPHRRAQKMRSYESPHERSLEATTAIAPIRAHPSHAMTLARASCSTARRHQIRVHCAAIGHPLTGDALYGSAEQLRIAGDRANRKFFLHASTAQFTHPVTGSSIRIEADLPSIIDAW